MNYFKKNEFIVCLNTPESELSFPRNFIFQQREDCRYLRTHKDLAGRENGWSAISYLGDEKYSEWRYATPIEIQEYKRLGHPFDVTTLPCSTSYYEIF